MASEANSLQRLPALRRCAVGCGAGDWNRFHIRAPECDRQALHNPAPRPRHLHPITPSSFHLSNPNYCVMAQPSFRLHIQPITTLRALEIQSRSRAYARRVKLVRGERIVRTRPRQAIRLALAVFVFCAVSPAHHGAALTWMTIGLIAIGRRAFDTLSRGRARRPLAHGIPDGHHLLLRSDAVAVVQPLQSSAKLPGDYLANFHGPRLKPFAIVAPLATITRYATTEKGITSGRQQQGRAFRKTRSENVCELYQCEQRLSPSKLVRGIDDREDANEKRGYRQRLVHRATGSR